MQAKIIRIGNSKGLRLSKTILEKYDIQESVELVLKEKHIELRPKPSPRSNWDEQFKKARGITEDDLLIPDVFEDEEFEEWI